MQFLLDAPLEAATHPFRGAGPHPAPFLHQEFPVPAVGLEIDRRDDLLADQHRQRKISKSSFFLRDISLEPMIVTEDERGPLALDDQWIEGREDVHEIRRLRGLMRQRLGRRPVRLLRRVVQRHRHQVAAPDPRLDQAPHRRLARRIEVADRVETDHALRAQRAIEPVGDGFGR